MAHGSLLCDPRPVPAALLQQGANFDIKWGIHAATIAKDCDSRKHHIAAPQRNTAGMERKPANQVVSEALRHFMGSRWNNVTLSKASGVAESTIRNYLSPEKRNTGASGKAPSAKLTELELLADALGVYVEDLVRDATKEERMAVHRAHAARYYERFGRLPPWAPDATAEPAQPLNA